MTLPTPHSTPLTKGHTDMNFGVPGGRVLRYERLDLDSMKETSPELEEMPRLEYNLMSDLDEVMMRNKSSSLSAHVGRLPAVAERAPAVADLISLDTGEEASMVFDPL